MENNEFHMSGIIEGIDKEKQKEEKKTKFQFIIKNIREQIYFEFKNKPYIHIYDRFSEKYNTLKIFIILLNNTKYNKRKTDIIFLITIKEDYPQSPPMVHCLTEFNKNLDIFDMRNIQKNIIPNWSSNYTIKNIIDKFFPFIENFNYQIDKKLFPSIGEYYLLSNVYDINDFLLNKNNEFFRVKICKEKNGEIKFKSMYLIITKNYLLFLQSSNCKNKNLCLLKYVINIIGIERIRRFLKEEKEFAGLSCFKIVSNKYILENVNKKIFNSTICADDNNLCVKKINELINYRKMEIMKNFKLFENSQCNEVGEIENIINIKKKIFENNLDENIFYQIQELYNKLIEISSNRDDGSNFSIYVKKFQNFLDEYDKLKSKEFEKDKKIYGHVNNT